MASRAVVLLFMAAVASGHIIPRPHHQMVLMPGLSGCPQAFEPAPIICRFMQPEQFHYKPQLIAPSTYIPPLVVEKCYHPELEIELPAPEKPIVIPEPPVLPPITIPKFPVPVFVEKPLPLPIVEPCESALVPDSPAMDISIAPEIPSLTAMPIVAQPETYYEVVPEFHQPLIVPQAPQLPPFVMPEIPAVEVPAVEPCLEDQAISVVPIPEYVPSMPLPIAENIEPEMHVVKIPTPPELPPLEMPVFPEIVAQPEPCFDEIVAAIPHPPKPTFVIAEEPIRVEEPMVEPCLEGHGTPVAPAPEYMPLPAPLPQYIPFPEPMPMPVAEPVLTEMPTIPMAPELPQLVMPALPEIVAEPESVLTETVAPEVNFEPLVVSQIPDLPAFMLPRPVRDPAIAAPCPSDQVPIAIPEYIPSPVLTRLPFPGFPLHAINNPEDPCITGEISLYAPQLPKLPKPMAVPIVPAAEPVIVDPCEPSARPAIKVSDLPPYFVRRIPRIQTVPMDYNYYPGPYMRHMY